MRKNTFFFLFALMLFQSSSFASQFILQKNSGLPITVVGLTFERGAGHDPKGKEGLAQITARLLKEGGVGTLTLASGKKLKESNANVWLINTGMTGGAYGVGSRMSLKYTRALITEALNGNLENVEYETLPIFNFQIPKSCPGVPSEILNPRNTWANKDEYDTKAKELAVKFRENFKKYEQQASEDILAAAPQI